MSCNNFKHVLERITLTDTNVVLTVSNSTNIGNLEIFELAVPCNKSIKDAVTGSPLPVLINVNGEDVALYNKNSIQIKSNHVPRRSKGSYVVSATGTPYVILYTTPVCKANN